MTKTKYSMPWNDATIKRLIKRRQKLYLHARKSNDPDVKNHYNPFRVQVQNVERDAYWKHVSNNFTFENHPSDPDSNKSGIVKKFCSFVKSLKKDAFGTTSLRENKIRSFLSIQYVHGDLSKHLGIDLSTDHPDQYSNLFLNAYINRHVHAEYLKMI